MTQCRVHIVGNVSRNTLHMFDALPDKRSCLTTVMHKLCVSTRPPLPTPAVLYVTNLVVFSHAIGPARLRQVPTYASNASPIHWSGIVQANPTTRGVTGQSPTQIFQKTCLVIRYNKLQSFCPSPPKISAGCGPVAGARD